MGSCVLRETILKRVVRGLLRAFLYLSIYLSVYLSIYIRHLVDELLSRPSGVPSAYQTREHAHACAKVHDGKVCKNARQGLAAAVEARAHAVACRDGDAVALCACDTRAEGRLAVLCPPSYHKALRPKDRGGDCGLWQALASMMLGMGHRPHRQRASHRYRGKCAGVAAHAVEPCRRKACGPCKLSRRLHSSIVVLLDTQVTMPQRETDMWALGGRARP